MSHPKTDISGNILQRRYIWKQDINISYNMAKEYRTAGITLDFTFTAVICVLLSWSSITHSILTTKLFLHTLRTVLLCLFFSDSFLFLASVCFSKGHLYSWWITLTNKRFNPCLLWQYKRRHRKLLSKWYSLIRFYFKSGKNTEHTERIWVDWDSEYGRHCFGYSTQKYSHEPSQIPFHLKLTTQYSFLVLHSIVWAG